MNKITEEMKLLERDIKTAGDVVTMNPVYEILKDTPNPAEYSNALVAALVDTVIVYDENRVEVKWKFNDMEEEM